MAKDSHDCSQNVFKKSVHICSKASKNIIYANPINKILPNTQDIRTIIMQNDVLTQSTNSPYDSSVYQGEKGIA